MRMPCTGSGSWREELRIENIDICPGCHCLTHLPTHLCEKITVEDRVLMAQMIFENNLRGKH